MRRLRAFVRRATSSFARSRAERDMAAELESHLLLHVDDNIRAGMSPEEARRRAVLALGGLEAAKERYRDRRGLPLIDTLRQDLAYAARALRKDSGLAGTAILTLALAIGATSAIFSVINAVLLQPLPFPAPERLVMVYANGQGDERHDVVSYPTFVDWRDQSRSFVAASAFATRNVTVDIDGQTELVSIKLVSASFFRVLGVPPALGRSFQPGDDADPAARIAMLSDGFWRRQFGAAPDVVGKTLRLSGAPYTVVGVMPAGFHLDSDEREPVYVPLPIDVNRRHGFVRIVARLQPDVSVTQARLDLDTVAARLTRSYPRNEARSSTVEPLVDALAGPSRLALLTLFGIVALLLLISCANVAGLLLARGVSRERELAVRAALGASRTRIVRQLLTESLLLALAGGIAGLLLASMLARLLVLIVSATFAVPRLDATHTDAAVVLFAFIVSLATGTLFGLVPAWSAASPDLNQSLREATQQASRLRMPRVGRGLVVAQAALALVLLAGAGTLMKTLLTMRTTHPGFDTNRMIAFELWLPPAHLPRLEDRARFFGEALARTRGLPGIEAAALVADLPLGGFTDSQSFHIVGRPDPAPDRAFNSGFNVASAGYFRMMRIPIREGRDFGDGDGAQTPGVAIVNETAVRRFWPDRSPIGSQISLPIERNRSTLLTVVGVAGDVRHRGLAEPPRPEIFLSSLQSELSWSEAVLAVRTAAADPTMLAAPIKAALREVDPNVPLARVRTMDEIVQRSLAEPRLFAWLVGAFAVAALALAAIGLYGLVSYTVTQRSREMGIRLALGATGAGVVRLILAQGVRLATVGAVLGVAGGLAATRVLVGLVKGVEPNDPATFTAVVAVLFAIAVIAAYLPARRAARVDPIRALRVE
jgi:putative ABC transport system permease protein